MKTIRMSHHHVQQQQHYSYGDVSSSVNQNDGNAASGAEAIDAFAQQCLQRIANDHQVVESSLGGYITSVLRSSATASTITIDVKQMEEYDGLMELIQEHCSVDTLQACEALQKISRAVGSGIIPAATGSPFLSGRSGGFYHSSGESDLNGSGDDGTSGLNSLGSLGSALPNASDDFPPLLGGSATDSTPPPIRADTLLPGDLLGEFEEPSRIVPSSQPGGAILEEFPPLGASGSTGSSRKNKKGSRSFGIGASASSKAGCNSSGSLQQLAADEVAASLFRPSSRSHSIDETSNSQQSTASNTTAAQISGFSPTLQPISSPNAGQNDPGHTTQQQQMYYTHQQWAHTVEMLLSMNMGVADEAASAATTMAHADPYVAQYILDKASTAPQVCRHLLKDGCYRADCTFSHDVDGHTCMFWLKGRCGKGETCRFNHGFSEKLLEGLYQEQQYAEDFIPEQKNYYNSGPSATVDSDGFQSKQTSDSAWHSLRTELAAPSSFARIASQGYKSSDFAPDPAHSGPGSNKFEQNSIGTVRIPQDLWNPHENRDSRVFFLPDPLERYQQVSATSRREDVIDLHFQSTKTFPVVLDALLDDALVKYGQVWVVTGTGHHVGTRTHQAGGGALERAVQEWLQNRGYHFARGKDSNGEGGAVLVTQ